MGSNQDNGRNVNRPDENRPSWRAADQNIGAASREGGGDYRERERDRDDERYGYGRMGRGPGSRMGSAWEDDRDEAMHSRERGSRETDRYGQGQSGYGSGRYGEDRSMRFQSRNQGYAGGRDEDRQTGGMGLDDRWGGRGGSDYWQDRQDRNWYSEDRGGERGRGQQGYYGEDEYRGGHRPGGQQGMPGWGQQSAYGYGQQGPSDRMGPGYASSQGTLGHQQGFGQQGGVGYGQNQQGTQGYGSQGPGLGRSGGYTSQWSQNPWNPTQVGGHRGKGPQGYTRSDERIRETVCEVLSDDDHIDASHIEVTVQDGEVILTGTVEDRQQKRLAEEVVDRLPGVKDVQNQLRVQDRTQARGNPMASGQVGKNETERSVGDRSKNRA